MRELTIAPSRGVPAEVLDVVMIAVCGGSLDLPPDTWVPREHHLRLQHCSQNCRSSGVQTNYFELAVCGATRLGTIRIFLENFNDTLFTYSQPHHRSSLRSTASIDPPGTGPVGPQQRSLYGILARSRSEFEDCVDLQTVHQGERRLVT